MKILRCPRLHLIPTIAGLAIGSGLTCSADLVALWQFEETSGTPIADSVSSLTLNLTDGPNLNVTGKNGSGVDFSTDGPNAGRLTTGGAAAHAATQQTGDFSILTWYKPTSGDLANNFARIIDSSSNNSGITTGYRIFTGGSAQTDRIRFLAAGAPNTDITHTRALTADVWSLIALRYDTDGLASLTILHESDTVDDAFVTTQTQTTAANGAITYSAGENTNFGSMDTPTLDSNDIEGVLDDAAFFDHLLSDAEISLAFNSGAATFLVPEPSSLALLGFGGLALARLRRNKK